MYTGSDCYLTGGSKKWNSVSTQNIVPQKVAEAMQPPLASLSKSIMIRKLGAPVSWWYLVHRDRCQGLCASFFLRPMQPAAIKADTKCISATMHVATYPIVQ